MNRAWLGSDNDYIDTNFQFSYFNSLLDNLILALNISGGVASGDVPFDGYQNYGVRNSLRGYEAGKYKGRNMIASQAELRWRFYNKWGAVVFGGTGSIWGNENNGGEEFEKAWLPSGVGGFTVYDFTREENKHSTRLRSGRRWKPRRLFWGYGSLLKKYRHALARDQAFQGLPLLLSL